VSDVVYLSLKDLIAVVRRTLGVVELRDAGGLESAAARPQTTVFGADAYGSLDDKAAALCHSIVRNHPLVDGNKRLGLAALIAFYGLNGLELTFSNDEAHDLIMAIATGELDDVSTISGQLAGHTRPRRRRDEG
jgi:death-on-curing protein